MDSPLKFTTTDVCWTFESPKEGGANDAGQFGGFYSGSNGTRCLIKQDSRVPLNIAEFVAGKIYQAIVPEVSAKIQLVRVDETIRKSHDGLNVYLLSEFIPKWRHDLYTEIQLELNRNPRHSKYKLLETMEVTNQLIFRSDELANFFLRGQNQGNYLNFGQVAATSLLINNTDTNLGNLGIIEEGLGCKKLAIVDYGAAFRQMTTTINPHAFKKYLSSHTIHREGWNNFLFYPESIKITPEFVSELDRASTIDLAPVINNAFDEIAEYYGIKPIIEFAVRAGLAEPLSKKGLTKIEGNDDLTKAKLVGLKRSFINNLKQRQTDLSRFSAQIKIDMCIKTELLSKEGCLDGCFIDKDNSSIRFNDVVFQHPDYFKAILMGKEQFKFRKSVHKYLPRLIDEVNAQSMIVMAGFLFVEKNETIRNQLKITTMDNAIAALKNKELDPKILDGALAFTEASIKQAKAIVLMYEQDKIDERWKKISGIIRSLNINVDQGAECALKNNKALQSAIIELDQGCNELGVAYDAEKKAALNTYKTSTIQLALQGVDAFKSQYSKVENAAILAIDDNRFTNYARVIGNIILTVCAAVSVVGLFAMLYTRSERGGVLFFHGPERDLTAVVSKLKVSLVN